MQYFVYKSSKKFRRNTIGCSFLMGGIKILKLINKFFKKEVDKKKYGHPTIKNLNFIENHIINSSKEGDVVLDCFCGSGTTLVGAINTKRQFIGFEINKKYMVEL